MHVQIEVAGCGAIIRLFLETARQRYLVARAGPPQPMDSLGKTW
jgi:hypothetical protein